MIKSKNSNNETIIMRRTIMPYRGENIFLRHNLKRKSFSPIVQLLSWQKLTTTSNTLTIKETKLKQQESLSCEKVATVVGKVMTVIMILD